MDKRIATYDGSQILGIIFLIVIVNVIPYGYIFSLLLLLIIFKQIILRMMFLGPTKKSGILENEQWDHIVLENCRTKISTYQNWKEEISPLVVFVHGWQSSSKKFEDRMKIFSKKGCHTIAIDMRGHGGSEDTPEWTAGKIISDVKFLFENIDKERVSQVHMYGHSLGGFVCIGLHNKRHTGWWKDLFGTLILESPMVAYSPIFSRSISKIQFMEFLLKRWVIEGFHKIHRNYGKLSWDQIDMPKWGNPDCPILVLQAANDNTLGMYHWNLINLVGTDIEGHILESLTHSKNQINQERDVLIAKWVDERII